MKKLMPILIGLMMILSVAVLASPPVPKPIRGYFKINDHNVAGYTVEIENLRTSEVVSGAQRIELITQSGGFAFDLSFFRASGYAEPIPGIYAGDPIEVRVVGVPDAKVRFNVPSVTPYEVTIQLRVDPSIETNLVYVCSDGSYVKDKILCPAEVPVTTVVIEEKIVQKIVCSDGVEVSDINECLETKEQVLGYSQAQLGLGAGVGAAFAALVVYYALKKKQRARAKKMIDTRIKRLKK